jgi:hypothetical protein
VSVLKNLSTPLKDLFSLVTITVLVLSDKDVARTDRTLKFFSGDRNQNLQVLYDILMTYCMYNFDLGEIFFVVNEMMCDFDLGESFS